MIEHTTTKRHYITAYTYPREHSTTRESVNQFSLVILIAQACLLKETKIVALLLRLTRHGISVGRRETKSELIYYIIPETTLTEILHSHGTTIHIIMQDVCIIVCRPVISYEHSLSFRLLLTLFISKLSVFWHLAHLLATIGNDAVGLCLEFDTCRIYIAIELVAEVLNIRSYLMNVNVGYILVV